MKPRTPARPFATYALGVSVTALTVLGLSLTAACSSGSAAPAKTTAAAPAAATSVAPPSAWDRAGALKLDAQKGAEFPGLHQVFVLSKNIISGSEPHGPEGLASVAKLGVKTVISVDGKVPDAEEARTLGLRYVHLPIQYKSINAEELLALTKTFRECAPPFYVHCFHGQHRGPAAAGVGRRALDGADGERAIAEMRQWMGTGQMYPGLYETVLNCTIPDRAATAAFTFNFPVAQTPEGIAEHMTHIGRAHDALKTLNKSGWKPDAAHPDLDAGNEARKLSAQMAANWSEHGAALLPGLEAEQDTARAASAKLLQSLEAKDWDGASAAFQRVDANCKACHSKFRNL